MTRCDDGQAEAELARARHQIRLLEEALELEDGAEDAGGGGREDTIGYVGRHYSPYLYIMIYLRCLYSGSKHVNIEH